MNREPLGSRGHEVVDGLHEGLREAIDARSRRTQIGDDRFMELLEGYQDAVDSHRGLMEAMPPVGETHPL